MSETNSRKNTYFHAAAAQCTDNFGKAIFCSKQQYTCAEVVQAGYCSYLNFGSFQCAKKLLQHEQNLCEMHQKMYADQTDTNDKLVTTPTPYFLREKKASLVQDASTALKKLSPFHLFRNDNLYAEKKEAIVCNVKSDKVENDKPRKVLKNTFNEDFIVDETMEQAIEYFVLSVLSDSCQ